MKPAPLSTCLTTSKTRVLPSALQPRFAEAFTTNISVIDFHQSFQRIVLLAVSHRGSKLVSHPTCTVIANAHQLAQTSYRKTFYVGTSQGDGGNSFRDGQTGFMQNRTGGNRYLIFAASTFIQDAAFEDARAAVLVVWNDEAVRPEMLFYFFMPPYLLQDEVQYIQH